METPIWDPQVFNIVIKELKKMNTDVTEFDADSFGRSNLKLLKMFKKDLTLLNN